MTLIELRQQRADAVDSLAALNDQIGSEAPTEEQRTKWDSLESNISDLDAKIAFEEKREKQRERAAAQKAERLEREKKQNRSNREKDDEDSLNRNFSIVRAMRATVNQRNLDGAEAEAYQEAQKEAREFGKDLEGNIAVPASMMREQRDQVVGTGNLGGDYVFTQWAGHIESLQPRPILERAGATIMRGLTSNVSFTKNTAVTASWEGETDANAEVTTTASTLDLTPNRVGAENYISKQLMVQSSPDIENIMRRELRQAIENAVDQKGINGDGTGNTPTGILNASSVNVIPIGTNGGAIEWLDVLKLPREVAVDNADLGRMRFLTTPELRAELQATEKATGTAQFIWQDMTMPMDGQVVNVGSVNGYQAMVSTNVPNDLTKGTGTDLNALIFGHFPALYMANWGGLDIVVDPYSAANQAKVRIVVNSWWDIGLRHDEHFAVIKDATVTA
jgi:HK97 family phage major capsid protein